MSAMRPWTRSTATASSMACVTSQVRANLNCGLHGVFQIVRVVSRHFVSMTEVHAMSAAE
jgi:hypothetical protein